LLLGRWVDGVVATYLEKHIFSYNCYQACKIKAFFSNKKLQIKALTSWFLSVAKFLERCTPKNRMVGSSYPKATTFEIEF
jgi:hypothetical protein